MLLRGKYDVLINVTWDCFDQSPEMFRNNNFVNKDGQKISFGRIHQKRWPGGITHLFPLLKHEVKLL
jgi:hypothetical protein